MIKNTFLSNTDNASVSLRKLLLESCNLHTVLDCPGGTFQGAGVKTVVLFFDKGAPTKKTGYYQLTWKKFGEDNRPAEGSGPGGVRGSTEEERRFAEELDGRREVDRQDDFRLVGEEPERR